MKRQDLKVEINTNLLRFQQTITLGKGRILVRSDAIDPNIELQP